MARLAKRVWESKVLSDPSVSGLRPQHLTVWTWCFDHLREVGKGACSFNKRCLKCILGIRWQDMHSTPRHPGACQDLQHVPSQCRLWWLGHVCPLKDGRLAEDILYKQLAQGIRGVCRSFIRTSAKEAWKIARPSQRAGQLGPWTALHSGAQNQTWLEGLLVVGRKTGRNVL